MGAFVLRAAAGTSALRPAASADQVRRRAPYAAGWHLYLDGTDRITSAELYSLEVGDSGPSTTGRLRALVLDPTSTIDVASSALTDFVDGDADELVWRGRLISRAQRPRYAAGYDVSLEAVDLSAGLDQVYVIDDTIADGSTDREAVQYLIADYGTRVGLTAPDSTVEVTNLALADVFFVNRTLRQALETVAAAAGDGRSFYVDAQGRLVYGLLAAETAPYAISDAPNGTTSVAAEELDVEYDTSNLVNAVYIGTAAEDAIYAEWVTDAASIAAYGRREALVVEENVVDAASAAQYGNAYLATRKDPQVRGRFTVTDRDGWRAGQTVTITNAALDLSGAQYQITQVDTEFLTGTGTRRYRISFGGLPKSLVRALAAGE